MASGEYSGLVITHLFYKFSLLLALFRWIFSWVFRLLSLIPSDSSIDTYHQPIVTPSSSSSQTPVSAQAIRDSLHVATYGEISDRQPNGDATCAVCLNKLRCHDKVWELRSCCHVFHKRCLDRWLDHDEHKTCPLCRAPLLGPSLPLESTEPSWAVERLLYHFGDDLLFPSS